MNESTPEPTRPEGTDEDRADYVQEREDSDGNAEPTSDEGRHVGRRPGDGGAEIPDNADVEPGDEPEPRSDRDDGAQDDGSDPVSDDDAEPGDDEPHDDRR